MSLKKGHAVEKQAKIYLCAKGLILVESNYNCLWGEIDLIMRDKEYLVFIEVRARKSATYGNAVESITKNKKEKIIKTALHYMIKKHLLEKYPTRFDVIAVQGENDNMEWIKDAFGDHT